MKFWLVRLGSVVAAIGAIWLIQTVSDSSLRFNEQRLVALAGLYVTLAVSLNLINGITGQFSIGHAAFYQVGAYTAGYFSIHNFAQQHMPPAVWLILMALLGAVAASVAGFVVGLPSLRLKGDYLAIVTLGFGEIIRILINNTPALGGSYALDKIPKLQFIWLIWLLALICIAVCRNLLKTAHGLSFLAVREDEVASAAMGVRVTQIKVTAFVIGSAFAGAAGALLAHYETSITTKTFGMEVSFIILTMVVLGGTGSITGSALAAVALFYLPEWLRGQPPVTGASLLASAITVVALTWAVRKIISSFHGAAGRKALMYVGAVLGGVLLQILLKALFSLAPTFVKATYEGDKLRMVIFAATLIVLMLIRPQGVLSHHEFSWNWVKGLFGRRRQGATT